MHDLTTAEILQAFAEPETARRFPPLLTEMQAAELLHIARKTLGNWRRDGRLEGIYSKRGKTVLYFRDRLVKHHFTTSKEWNP